AGDTYAVYPGARSSIRFERLMEGIQDAEKIRIVRAGLEQDTSTEGKEKLDQFNKMLEQFNILTKPENLEAMLAKGKAFLNNPEFFK
ncbi:MAG: DUF4091 domain-containing protein, partial [Bacteroidales bacterium]|nr:DUF4091 domain-containing protein [Bacteroidales bacterium]